MQLLLEVGGDTRPRGSQACEDLARRQGYVEVADWVVQYEKRMKNKKNRKQKRQQKKQRLKPDL